jgi:hypothetical protein
MANLKMSKKQQVLALLDLGWSYRRIESETGIRRETVSRYAALQRAKTMRIWTRSGGRGWITWRMCASTAPRRSVRACASITTNASGSPLAPRRMAV